MTRIFIPNGYASGTFLSLEKAMCVDRYPEYRLEEIVRYNKVYRDYLRTHGMDKMIEMLSEKLPNLSNSRRVFDYLKESFEKTGLADYDIQCLPINSNVCLNGVKFHGLEDIRKRVTFSVNWKSSTDKEILLEREKESLNGLEIIEVYEFYPCFDSYDSMNENRFFRNYILTREKVTPQLIRQIFKMKIGGNIDLCTEHINKKFLPLVYYVGEGKYMLVASYKNQPTIFEIFRKIFRSNK